MEFLAGGLLPLAGTLDKLLKSMPRTDFGLVHSLIQSASGARNAQTFVKLCDLIEERLEALAREALEGGRARQKAPPGLKPGKTSASARADMEVLNLDKGAFLLSAFSDMESIVRKIAQFSPA